MLITSTIKRLITDLFSDEDPKDLLSSLAPLAVEMVSTFPSKSNVVSIFSLEGSAGLSARGDRLYYYTKQLKIKQQKRKTKRCSCMKQIFNPPIIYPSIIHNCWMPDSLFVCRIQKPIRVAISELNKTPMI